MALACTLRPLSKLRRHSSVRAAALPGSRRAVWRALELGARGEHQRSLSAEDRRWRLRVLGTRTGVPLPRFGLALCVARRPAVQRVAALHAPDVVPPWVVPFTPRRTFRSLLRAWRCCLGLCCALGGKCPAVRLVPRHGRTSKATPGRRCCRCRFALLLCRGGLEHCPSQLSL